MGPDGSYALDNHTHPEASSISAGFMSASDKGKLENIESFANVNTIESISLNGTNIVPDADKNVNIAIPIVRGATASVGGAAGLVPGPTAGDNEKFLRGDGT